jgi:hypothetical protein
VSEYSGPCAPGQITTFAARPLNRRRRARFLEKHGAAPGVLGLSRPRFFLHGASRYFRLPAKKSARPRSEKNREEPLVRGAVVGRISRGSRAVIVGTAWPLCGACRPPVVAGSPPPATSLPQESEGPLLVRQWIWTTQRLRKDASGLISLSRTAGSYSRHAFSPVVRWHVIKTIHEQRFRLRRYRFLR